MDLDKIAHHPGAQVINDFEHAGLDCLVVKIRDSHYCGYVQTPFEGDHEDFVGTIEVCGGLTYGIDDDGWVGFDTLHHHTVSVDSDGDPIGPLSGYLMDSPGVTEWGPRDVVDETVDMAKQFAELIPEGELPKDDAEFVE